MLDFNRVVRLFILSLPVLEVQFGKSFKRNKDLDEQGFIRHKILWWSLCPC